ncbi:hypothetical protein [Haloferax sp. YSSS75]|uniref:hypothetical protein n=1 Tax=Haloferax sp. YSSS75 TaxID=3388564 RepID=UPI00398CAA36
MPSPFDFGDVDITQFTSHQTAKFLRSLLQAEASANNIGVQNTHVPIRVNIPDGGLDAEAQNDSGSETPLIPIGRVGYQLKRSDLSPSKCKKEVQNDEETELKPMVKQLLDDGGTYCLVVFEDLTDQKISSRKEAFKEVFSDYGYDTTAVEIVDSSKLVTIAQQYPSLALRYDPNLDVGVDFGTWRNRREIKSNYNYIEDDARRRYREEILGEIRSSKACSIIRVSGLSGVGKSRFVYETIFGSEFEDLTLHVSSENLQDSRLLRHLETEPTSRCILVVDNCSPEYHSELVNRFGSRGKRVQIITISDTLEKVTSDIQIELSPLDDSEIEIFVETERPDLSKAVVNKIVEFSGGFPQIAVQITTTVEYGGWDSEFELPSRQFMRKFLIGTVANDHPDIDDLRRTLSAFALFDRVGWEDHQGNRHAEFLEIYETFGLDSVAGLDGIEEIVGYARQRGLLQGDKSLSLQPLPVALLLIKSHLERHDLDEGLLQLSESLIVRVENRLQYLNAFESGRMWVKDTLSRNGWFRNTSLLESEPGSRVFKGLAFASAEDATKVLQRFFRTTSQTELKKLKEGRRNLIEAIRAIAVWDTTFDDAASFLRRLALAENEPYTNNATGVYQGLFSPAVGQVAPTERHPRDRLSHIEDGLTSDNQEKFELALGAASQALKTGHYVKSGRPERQGARELPDLWVPESREDWISYFETAWNIIISRVANDKHRSDELTKILTDSARRYVSSCEELSRLVRNSYIYLTEADWVSTDQIMRSTMSIVKYDVGGLSDSEQELWEEFEDWLIHRSFHTRFLRYVVVNDMITSDERKDTIDPLIDEIAREAISNPPILYQEYDCLFEKQASRGHILGRYLAEADDEFEFMESIVNELKERELQAIPSFALAYFAKVKEEDTEQFEKLSNQFEVEEQLQQFMVPLVRIVAPTDDNVERLLKKVDTGEIDVEHLRDFANLTSPNEFLSEDIIQDICTRLLNSDSQSAHSALDLLNWTYIYPDQHPQLDTDYLTSAVTHEHVLILDDTIKQTRGYDWAELVSEIVSKSSERGPEILEAVIEASESENAFVGWAGPEASVLGEIIQSNPEGAWDVISSRLLTGELSAWWTTELLSGGFSLGGPLFGLLNWDDVNSWIQENPEERAEVIANSIGVSLPETVHQTTVTREMLAEYGHLESVQEGLRSTYFTEHWVGSSVEHFKNKKSEIQQALDIEEGRDDTAQGVLRWGEKILDDIGHRIAQEEVREELIGY